MGCCNAFASCVSVCLFQCNIPATVFYLVGYWQRKMKPDEDEDEEEYSRSTSKNYNLEVKQNQTKQKYLMRMFYF